MTSLRHQSPVNDVIAESRGAPDDVIFSDDDDDQPLERDIVRRRIDLFEKQVSRSDVLVNPLTPTVVIWYCIYKASCARTELSRHLSFLTSGHSDAQG